MYGDHKVPSSLAALPNWLQEYIAWNQNERATKDPKDLKYIVMKCTKSQTRCGGFSDRLRPLPFYLLLAQKTNRILCIYWDRPMRLEHYLQVPKNGLDWACPSDFEGDTGSRDVNAKFLIRMDEKVKKYALQLVSRIKSSKQTYIALDTSQSTDQINCMNNIFNAYSYQDRMPKVSKWMHINMMEHIFRVMFKPIPAIARNINATMTQLGLVEGNFTSIHLRARYPTPRLQYILGKNASALDKGHFTPTFDGRFKSYLMQLTNNAVECGYLLDTKRPFVFISDSVDLVDHVIENRMNVRGSQVQILGVKQRPNIIHLNFDNTNVEDTFYPLFEDLLIMGGGSCMAHGLGSFGAFGAGLAGNRCRALHRNYRGAPIKCPNNDTSIEFVPITNNELMLD
ncbi:hypothetical protein CTEN210_07219 [Chaetoceros tenuissimus]|uniref:Uncharacterized protein n=1 Tax=Chaetoceros tenuissimus TaxID=426638 RepID=A0AAD3CRU7_9STRA|nr:hypothetical protein CTEN210_07219 [Chaetoceros tenuissimus]